MRLQRLICHSTPFDWILPSEYYVRNLMDKNTYKVFLMQSTLKIFQVWWIFLLIAGQRHRLLQSPLRIYRKLLSVLYHYMLFCYRHTYTIFNNVSLFKYPKYEKLLSSILIKAMEIEHLIGFRYWTTISINWLSLLG